jgi:hypothetical protein
LTALPLQTLNLSQCNRLTDGGLMHLAALPLQTLRLYGCDQLTNTGLAILP